MKYHNITKDDMKNGDGLRVVLWLSGCDHHCKGCQNPITWDPNDGLEFDNLAREELFKELNKKYIDGITLSGGDPLYTSNREEVLKLIKEIKIKFPTKTIWIYTGYMWEEIIKDSFMYEIVKLCDILIDGEYMENLRDDNYEWAGSTNQLVIDIKRTLKEGQVILYGNNEKG